MTFLTYPSL